MKRSFSYSLFGDKISYSGVFGVTEYKSAIKILIILNFQGQFQNGGLFFSEKYKCCYRNKCDLPWEKEPNAAKPDFTREPSERSLKSCTSDRIGQSWKWPPPPTTAKNTLPRLWNLDVRAHMDTIKHEVWVSGGSGHKYS